MRQRTRSGSRANAPASFPPVRGTAGILHDFTVKPRPGAECWMRTTTEALLLGTFLRRADGTFVVKDGQVRTRNCRAQESDVNSPCEGRQRCPAVTFALTVCFPVRTPAPTAPEVRDNMPGIPYETINTRKEWGCSKIFVYRDGSNCILSGEWIDSK
jgi:hypothetical protein